MFRGVEALERETRVLRRSGIHDEPAVIPGSDGDRRCAIYRRREDESLVVVGMLTDEIDPSGG